MKRKGLLFPVGVIALIVAVYLLGPKAPRPELKVDLPPAIQSPEQVAAMVEASESSFTNIKPGNASEIVWASDSLKNKTNYCLLYLHGFSASPMEGNPIHRSFANEFGMNAYIPRLAEHGLVTENALLNMTPDALWESAKLAFVQAKALGNEVIIMGTSTGGTLGLMLAAHYKEDVAGLLLYSPNVRIYDKTAGLLDRPWGLQIVRLVMGGDYRVLEEDPETDPYWYNTYRVESLIYLQQLIRHSMKASVFSQVSCPVFTGYYFKDEDNQDNTVSVSAINWMFDQLATPTNQKVEMAFPEAGAHVIACDLTSGQWQDVLAESIKFGDEILRLGN